LTKLHRYWILCPQTFASTRIGELESSSITRGWIFSFCKHPFRDCCLNETRYLRVGKGSFITQKFTQCPGTKSCVHSCSYKESHLDSLSLLCEPAVTQAFPYWCSIVNDNSTFEMIWIHDKQRLKNGVLYFWIKAIAISAPRHIHYRKNVSISIW
jgi:hypothetical protein